MRRLTLSYIEKLVKSGPKLGMDRRPSPMPGRKWPTRVAWSITVGDRKLVGQGTPDLRCEIQNVRSLSYIGKPNRYRALEAFACISRAVQVNNNLQLVGCWQAEFDKAGLVAYRSGIGKNTAVASGAFYAYHPHSPRPEIIEAFIQPLHLKYLGGMRLYSLKQKLTADAVDDYYEWFYKQFKKRLRRPRAQASATIAGEVVELGNASANASAQ